MATNKGDVPSQSRHFIHMFDFARGTWSIESQPPADDDLIARSNAGLLARNSLRNIGLKHLRLAIDAKLKSVEENYRLTQGEGRPPKNLLT